MLQLAYHSRASSSLTSDGIFKIIEISASNNLRDDLTGFLIFSADRFFQVVEGSKTAIDALMSRLGRDMRHSDIKILSRMDVTQRSFPNWRMKRLNPDAHWLSPSANGSGLDHFPDHLKQIVKQFLSSAPPVVTAA